MVDWPAHQMPFLGCWNAEIDSWTVLQQTVEQSTIVFVLDASKYPEQMFFLCGIVRFKRFVNSRVS